MKISRSLLPLFAVLTLLACGGSSDEEEVVRPTEYKVSISTANITLSDNGAATQMVNFETSGYWKAEIADSWCTATPSQGTSSVGQIVLSIDENTTTVERTTTLTISLASNTSVKASISITQPGKETSPEEGTPDGMKSNAMELVKNIKVGWCLGNTLESGIWTGWSGNDLDIETNWGNPKTTQAMINAVKNAGFNAVRVPVRWYVHADDNLNINAAWMARVKEVVDYAYNQGMYVVLNSHHDSWYDRLPVGYNENEIRTKYENMWKQIATTFKDYDEHLLLAGANEIIYLNSDGSENWGTPSTAQIKFAGDLMQLFVNTVRATGGNNAWRCLMVQPWACSLDNALGSSFSMPTDTRMGRLIFEFHNYTWTYSTESTDSNKYFWGKDYSGYTPWYSNGESSMDELYAKVKANFIDKGIAVIMAEFGAVQHNKSSDEMACDESRAYYLRYVVEKARENGFPGFYWDNNCFTTTGENFGLLDRSTCTFPARAQKALNGIMAGVK